MSKPSLLTVVDGRPAEVEHREQPTMLPPPKVNEVLADLRLANDALAIARRAAKKASGEKKEALEHVESVVTSLLEAAEREGAIEMRLPFTSDIL